MNQNQAIRKRLGLIGLVAALVGVGSVSCQPDYEDAPTKLVGVGYNPAEIGPAPTPYGGVVEYSWVNFAGGGLSLALMGLGAFDEVGPALVGYKPPYAAVYGFSYIFDTKLEAADSLGGVTSVPPSVDDTCYTTFEATGPIGSFKTSDIGSAMSLLTDDGAGGLVLDRLPGDYPADRQDMFIYYSSIDFWNATVQKGLVYDGETKASGMSETIVRRDNFPFGQEVSFSFPGALAPIDAPVASVPMPSRSQGESRFALPHAPGGVLVSWAGPRYDSFGRSLDSGDQARCLAYPTDDALAPSTAVDCDAADIPPAGAELVGQMYTGPWDAEEGITFSWSPGEQPAEYVSLAVRFLGPVDHADPNLQEDVVIVTPDEAADAAWKQAARDGSVPSGLETPQGRRAPAACEQGEWVFDDAFLSQDGGLAPAMRGDPFHNMAEVTCRLDDDGSFSLTAAIVEEAETYARLHGAQGAVFYFARSTELEAKVPSAKDQYNQRLDISPVKVTSRAIDIGRFWFDGGGQ